MFKRKMMLICLGMMVVAGIIGCDPAYYFLPENRTIYQDNKLYAMSYTDVNEVYIATLAAMDKLQFQVDKTKKKNFGAEIVAKSSSGKLITVTMVFNGHDETGHIHKTSYNIQVGKHGDEEYSRKIYNEIIAELSIVKTK
jgi:hypothetical protein